MSITNPVAERIVLAGLCKYGATAYYDVVDIVQESTFTISSNANIFQCIKHILDQDDKSELDVTSVQAVSTQLGFGKLFYHKDEIQHLQAIFSLDVKLSNIRKFAAQLRKLEIARLLKVQLYTAQEKLGEITGEESIYEILGIAENAIFDFTATLNKQDNTPDLIGNDVLGHLEYLAKNPTVQIGIPTGFPCFDNLIGGGLRRGAINVIGARAKVGKTIFADNIGFYIASKLHIPVLNMDTEMGLEDHQYRLCAMMTDTPINQIETGKYANSPQTKEKIIQAGKDLGVTPYYHKSIAGEPFESQMATMRRWLVKDVGLNSNGTAKDCVIIYDYIKLMDAHGISDALKEYQLLGFLMTALHNFSVKYQVPILAFMQLNRDGITKTTTATASGSDRIIWLCDSFTVLKTKSTEEMAKDGPQEGNRKLIPLISRHGPGISEGDYISCRMKANCAKLTEGRMCSEIDADQSGFISQD